MYANMQWQAKVSGNFGNGREENNNIGWLLQVSLINEEKVPLTTFKLICSLTFFRFCYLPKQSIIIQETKSACCAADIPYFLFTCNFCQICPKHNSTKEKAYIRLLHKQDYLPHFRTNKKIMSITTAIINKILNLIKINK